MAELRYKGRPAEMIRDFTTLANRLTYESLGTQLQLNIDQFKCNDLKLGQVMLETMFKLQSVTLYGDQCKPEELDYFFKKVLKDPSVMTTYNELKVTQNTYCVEKMLRYLQV